ncbi:hypothetical protein BH24ACI3_BH24ACI3_05870 [soil metagenome]
MNYESVIGQTLDNKYNIERELGRGGMGTVYLATHLGTERPVAVKVIAPQFMRRPEFVERFRREARAAGRLRHPNVVDVTDFGFAETAEGRVAYLVMEYLDGCTLGEILDEERNLPVGWTLDILEQVCSAVQEAHEQGIIHSDLKPDNIWLEPNQRGGYTIKVLDFGIAKLEGTQPGEIAKAEAAAYVASPTRTGRANLTVADGVGGSTIHDNVTLTLIQDKESLVLDKAAGSESDTVIQFTADGDFSIPVNGGSGAAALHGSDQIPQGEATDDYRGKETVATRELTRVGAVLGTPLYMSPEQCRGEKLDARSDVYSIGIIAYQMLSGTTPFTGEFSGVMECHKSSPPPPLKVKKVRRKLKAVILSSLAKDPANRPQTAEAFATKLRSRSEGIFGLLRRAGMIYTEHVGKFLLLSAIFHIPMFLLTMALVVISFLRINEVISELSGKVFTGITATVLTIATALFTYIITGTITWIVVQSLAVPLRPIKVRNALKEARGKWRAFALTGLLSTLMAVFAGIAAFIVVALVLFLPLWAVFGFGGVSMGVSAGSGGFAAVLGFFFVSILLMLSVPVVMMEGSRGFPALSRSRELVRRSFVTAAAAFLTMFLIPAFAAGLMSAAINLSARAIDPDTFKAPAKVERTSATASESETSNDSDETNIGVSLGGQTVAATNDSERDMRTKVRTTILETLVQLLILPLQIFMTSLTAIIIALLYLKTRQAGGESLKDLLAKFEETEQPRKKWQERVRQRLIQSGRVSGASKSS